MNKPGRQSDASSRTVKTVSVADYIVDRLATEGIERCFGVAGDYVFPICRAVHAIIRKASVATISHLMVATARHVHHQPRRCG